MHSATVGIGLAASLIVSAMAATDSIPATGGTIAITPMLHSSLQIEYGDKVIQVDPWSLGDLTHAKPADLILLSACCDLHHIDPKAIQRLRKPGAPIIIPDEAGAKERVPDGFVLANGKKTTAAGIPVESVASYDAYITLAPFHPKGEGNGYVITLGGKRLFLAGVTECVPEIQALKNLISRFFPSICRWTHDAREGCRLRAVYCGRAWCTRITSTMHARGLWRIRAAKKLPKLKALRTRQVFRSLRGC